jgi:hypothetical protein
MGAFSYFLKASFIFAPAIFGVALSLVTARPTENKVTAMPVSWFSACAGT